MIVPIVEKECQFCGENVQKLDEFTRRPRDKEIMEHVP